MPIDATRVMELVEGTTPAEALRDLFCATLPAWILGGHHCGEGFVHLRALGIEPPPFDERN